MRAEKYLNLEANLQLDYIRYLLGLFLIKLARASH
jgi:hypothetical protein